MNALTPARVKPGLAKAEVDAPPVTGQDHVARSDPLEGIALDRRPGAHHPAVDEGEGPGLGPGDTGKLDGPAGRQGDLLRVVLDGEARGRRALRARRRSGLSPLPDARGVGAGERALPAPRGDPSRDE